MQLNTLTSKNFKSKKRLGRGIGSSKGKTSGRGHKAGNNPVNGNAQKIPAPRDIQAGETP